MNNQYVAAWMKVQRARKRAVRLLSAGKCPVCTVLLDSELHSLCRFSEVFPPRSPMVRKRHGERRMEVNAFLGHGADGQ